MVLSPPVVPSSPRYCTESRSNSADSQTPANRFPNSLLLVLPLPLLFSPPTLILSPPPLKLMNPKPDEETLISALNLWDDLWLQHNLLGSVRTIKKPRPLNISSLINKKETVAAAATAMDYSCNIGSSTTRALQLTPSLPPQQRDETENSVTCKITTRKLLHSCSSLDDRKHSSYYSKNTPPAATARHRPPRHTKLEGTKSDFMRQKMSFGKALDEKKCKSLSDLEYLEVQGFKDLGFDFSKEGLNATLMKVIPGLRDPGDDEKKVRRPYLSEAWSMQRSGPPVVRWAGRESAEDMKEQLKFWARNVACNVKQEC